MSQPTTPTDGIKKLHIKETVLFAINNIPQVDPTTLVQFLELVNANGSFGSMTPEQIGQKMRLVLKYIPKASTESLSVLADLLEIQVQLPNPPKRLGEAIVYPASHRPTLLAVSLETGPVH